MNTVVVILLIYSNHRDEMGNYDVHQSLDLEDLMSLFVINS